MTERIKKVTALTVANSNTPAIPDGWEEKFAQYIDESRSAANGSGAWQYLSTKNGVFSYMEAPLGKEIRVIVLGAVRENLKYEGRFVDGEHNPPICWAIDTDGTLEPSENVDEPVHPTCEGCPHDKWGSGEGRGKSCRNYVRLAMVAENDLTNGTLLRVPPTGITAWEKYANKVEKAAGRPLFSVVTTLKIVPRGGSFTVQPELGGFVNDPAVLEQLYETSKAAEEFLLKPYQPRDVEEGDDRAF